MTSASASSSTHIAPAKRKTRATDEASEIAPRVSNIGVGKSGIGVGLGGIGVGSGRVTRRSTAQAQQTSQGSGTTAEEPKKGAQESLRNGKDSDVLALTANKRQKVSLSPRSQALQTPALTNPVSIPQPAPKALSSSSPTKEPIPPLPIRRHLPYPIGLTPFRYPCHHPSQPPPPPGDPLDASWKPYDPYHPAHLEGLPSSVRALSVLERAARAGKAQGASGRAAQTLAQAAVAGTDQRGEGSKKRKGDDGIPIDPSLVSLPIPSRNAVDLAVVSGSNPDLGLTAIPSNQPQAGEGEFDFNSFFESATYETISALLSAGDDVGDATIPATGNGNLGYGGTSTARDT